MKPKLNFFNNFISKINCARNRTRTCTGLHQLAPEASASTNSAIRANFTISKNIALPLQPYFIFVAAKLNVF